MYLPGISSGIAVKITWSVKCLMYLGQKRRRIRFFM